MAAAAPELRRQRVLPNLTGDLLQPMAPPSSRGDDDTDDLLAVLLRALARHPVFAPMAQYACAMAEVTRRESRVVEVARAVCGQSGTRGRVHLRAEMEKAIFGDANTFVFERVDWVLRQLRESARSLDPQYALLAHAEEACERVGVDGADGLSLEHHLRQLLLYADQVPRPARIIAPARSRAGAEIVFDPARVTIGADAYRVAHRIEQTGPGKYALIEAGSGSGGGVVRDTRSVLLFLELLDA